MGLSSKMTDFFVNHTRKHIVRAEADAMFNLTKNLREIISRYHWSIDDHVEFLNSDNISHTRGRTLLIEDKYVLDDWMNTLQYFLSTCTQEYHDIILADYAGPFGV
jgi:hypothetical protein